MKLIILFLLNFDVANLDACFCGSFSTPSALPAPHIFASALMRAWIVSSTILFAFYLFLNCIPSLTSATLSLCHSDGCLSHTVPSISLLRCSFRTSYLEYHGSKNMPQDNYNAQHSKAYCIFSVMSVMYDIIRSTRFCLSINFDFVLHMPCVYRRLTLSAWAIHVGSAGHFIYINTSRLISWSLHQ